MANVGIVGSSGLVGMNMLSALISLPNVKSIDSLTRRTPSNLAEPLPAKLTQHMTPSDTWADTYKSISPVPSIIFSALGTTRAGAGSLAAQRLVDYDLALSVAKAARSSGTKVYVLCSSARADAQSMMGYIKMKGELEEAVKALGFDKVIILRPGVILGQRETSRWAESAAQWSVGMVGKVLGQGGKDYLAQDAQLIGRAGVLAGLAALHGRQAEDLGLVEERGVWAIGGPDLVRLGRTDWTSYYDKESKQAGTEGI